MSQRNVPRPFSMRWGEGRIVEEASFEGEHAAPAIQLMQFDRGDAAGTRAIRFCHFSLRGQFRRSPMILSESEIDELREAVGRTPELRRLLLRIAGA